jgi:hypothetical protein
MPGVVELTDIPTVHCDMGAGIAVLKARRDKTHGLKLV